MAGPGRSQRHAMERLVRLMAVLSAKGAEGASGDLLCEVAGFKDGDPISQLNREFKLLRKQGWQIDNIAEKGMPARYRMVKGDNRLRLRLTPEQQAALQRAALLADRDDLVEKLGLPQASRPTDVSADVLLAGRGEALDTVVNAVRHSCLLRFRYKGSQRTVHPASLIHRNGNWYLTGLEEGGVTTKHFVVSRMSHVESDAPDTARPVPPERRIDLHPMRWTVDPPVVVTLRTPAEYAPDVERWLEEPRTTEEVDGVVELTYVVTNRAALRSRLYMLGSRVTLVGPDEVRAEMLAELREMAGV